MAASRLKKFWRMLGPGIITGASDDDPSGIATYSQAGARFGYDALWTALFSFPFMSAVQEMCGRIGLVKGRGLSEVIKEHYGPSVLTSSVILLTVANVINIGANLGAMAAALQLIFPSIAFTWWLILATSATIVLEIFVPYRSYVTYLKYLTFSLFAYIITGFVVTTAWGDVLSRVVIPHIEFSKEYVMVIVALLGTTISPYLFFWQTSEEVEEEIVKHQLHAMDHGTPHTTPSRLRAMRVDTMLGMAFSNIIMLFIMLTVAGTLYAQNGPTVIRSATEAAEALRPFAGDFAFLLFTLGILGTGLLSVPVLAGSASYALSEAFGWRAGLYRTPERAPGFYAAISAAIILGLFINIVSTITPFQMLFYAAIVNGIIASPLLFIILKITNDPKIMGEHTNAPLSNFLGYTIAVVMAISSITFILLSL